MRSVFPRRIASVGLLLLLLAQSASALPQHERDRSWFAKIKHLVTATLDQLGWPKP